MFPFMPQTGFVIAADKDRVRHVVAKHFNDPNASHVRNYLEGHPKQCGFLRLAKTRAPTCNLLFVRLAPPDKWTSCRSVRSLGVDDSFDRRSRRLLRILPSSWTT